MTSHTDDFALLSRFAQSFDQQSFQELVTRHGSLVMGVCYRILNNAHDAQEASQATFVQLAIKAKKLNANHPLGPWLHTVARGKALDLYKSRKRYHARVQALEKLEMHAPDSIEKPAATETEKRELAHLLDESIEGLPEHYRTVIILHYLREIL